MTWRRTFLLGTLGGLSVPAMYLMFGRTIVASELLQNTVFSLSYSTCIAVFIHMALLLAGPRLSWTGLIALLTVCATVGCAAGTGLALVLLGLPLSHWFPITQSSLRICIPVSLAIGFIVALLENMRAKLRTTELELRTRELERERAEKLAAEARLSSLESRIHPHFLFNALNSISCLIREDPERAERLLGRMSSLLRFSLDSNQLGLVPLSKELIVVTDYLEIESARFGARLRYQVDAAPEMLATEVPPLSVQTLVENSIKYAVSPSRTGGEVHVCARGGVIEVRDSGPGFSLADVPRGHGLDLLQSRLAAVYGGHAKLEVEGNTVRLRLSHDARVSAGR
jgi:sensor histidine kinase YesM